MPTATWHERCSPIKNLKKNLVPIQNSGKLLRMNFKDKLTSLLTQFDAKQKTKKNYNFYALGLYLEQAERVVLDVELGAGQREALVAGFNGRLVDFLLKGFGLPVTTKDEQMGSGIYRPVSENHPDR